MVCTVTKNRDFFKAFLLLLLLVLLLLLLFLLFILPSLSSSSLSSSSVSSFSSSSSVSSYSSSSSFFFISSSFFFISSSSSSFFCFFFLQYRTWWTVASSRTVVHCSLSSYSLYVFSSLRQFPSHLPQLTQASFSYSSSAFWFKTNKPSARTQFLHYKEVIQPLLSSCFGHFNYV